MILETYLAVHQLSLQIVMDHPSRVMGEWIHCSSVYNTPLHHNQGEKMSYLSGSRGWRWVRGDFIISCANSQESAATLNHWEVKVKPNFSLKYMLCWETSDPGIHMDADQARPSNPMAEHPNVFFVVVRNNLSRPNPWRAHPAIGHDRSELFGGRKETWTTTGRWFQVYGCCHHLP